MQVDLSSITKMNYDTFFDGSEVVVTGRTIDKNTKRIFSEVSTYGRGMQNKKLQAQVGLRLELSEDKQNELVLLNLLILFT